MARFSSAGTTSGVAEKSVTLFSLAANRITKLRISAVTVALRRAGIAYDPRRRRPYAHLGVERW
jgi:hypothetical protein